MSNPNYFNTFDEYKTFIEQLGKLLHPQVEANLSDILKAIGYEGTPVPEVVCNGGRMDLVFYIPRINKSIHFEIFKSKSQIPQDLRLLEKSNKDIKVAIIIDPEIDESVSIEYYRKDPPKEIEVLKISDFFLIGKLDSTKEYIETCIRNLISKPQIIKEKVKDLFDKIHQDFVEEYGYRNPLLDIKRTKKIGEYMDNDEIAIQTETLEREYKDAVINDENRESEDRKKHSGIVIHLGKSEQVQVHAKFIIYFRSIKKDIEDWLKSS